MTTANTHLEHLQDYVFTDLPLALEMINTLNDTPNTGNLQFGVKYDGSVSIVFGVDPSNNKFFIGTKSVFNKTPKINYSTYDIYQNHGKTEGLCSKLVYVFSILEKHQKSIGGIFQGDLMFTPDILERTSTDLVKFTPNTITYYINNITATALLGLAVHTKYTSLVDPTPCFVFAPIKFTSDIHQFPVYQPGYSIDLPQFKYDFITNITNNIDMRVYNEFKDTEYSHLIKIYENSIIRSSGRMLDSNPDNLDIRGFLNWIIDRRTTAIKNYKTPSVMLTRVEMIKQDIQYLTRTDVVKMLHQLLETRTEFSVIIQTLNSDAMKQVPIKMAIVGESTTHEGVVVSYTDNINNDHWNFKAVDRLKFSRANFSQNKK